MYTRTAPAPQSKALVILSGGLDSAVALAITKQIAGHVTCITFDYKQRHSIEITYAKRLCEAMGVDDRLVMPLEVIQRFHGLQKGDPTDKPTTTEEALGLLPKTYKPGRNIIMLAVAATFAYTRSIPLVVGGWHQEDYPGYPDCRQEFLMSMERTLQEGLAYNVSLYAPLLHMRKHTIVNIGTGLDVPFQHTWSCYVGGAKACGTCDACVRRLNAFGENGLVDPIPYSKSATRFDYDNVAEMLK
jgi:7-cyano-7-deazaguanine synthase